MLSNSNSRKHNFLNKYKDCFGEIGTLPIVHHVTIDQNIDQHLSQPPQGKFQ